MKIIFHGTKAIIVAGLFLKLAASSFAQGTLEASLQAGWPNSPPLAGFASVFTPDTNGPGPHFPVAFQISVNSDSLDFNVGRISGGSTAWAFSLGSPSTNNGSTYFRGTTDMAPFQIDDMLAGRTSLEIQDNGFNNYLAGPLLAVPEPSFAGLFTTGLLFFCFMKANKTPLPGIPIKANNRPN